MEVFVINLDGSKDRLENITSELNKISLGFTRVPAVNGSLLDASELNRHYCAALNRKMYRRPLSRGEIGCYLSHRRCWQHIIDKKLPVALILEDDAALDCELPNVLSLIEQISIKWDLIKLCEPPKPKKILSSAPLNDHFDLCQYKKIPSRATGYLVSNEGATKLLQARNVFARPVDDDIQFYWEYSGVVFGVEPSPVCNSHFGDDSNIDSNEPRRSKKTLRSQFKSPILRLDYELKLLQHNRLNSKLDSKCL
jgi:glycosyl transferase family 25